MTQVDKFQAQLIREDKLAAYWPHILGELRKVPQIWSNYWTEEALMEAAFSERIQIWGVGDEKANYLIVVTQVQHYAVGRVLLGLFAFGNHLEECLPVLVATLQKYARTIECVRFEFIGRESWGPLLKPFGLQKSAVQYVYELPKIGVH